MIIAFFLNYRQGYALVKSLDPDKNSFRQNESYSARHALAGCCSLLRNTGFCFGYEFGEGAKDNDEVRLFIFSGGVETKTVNSKLAEGGDV